MKQIELLVQLLDQAIAGIERGRVEDLLEAQYAIYGVAMGAVPVQSSVDQKVVLLCEYCLDCLSHGMREEEWAAVRVLAELRGGLVGVLGGGVEAREVDELVDVTA